MTCLWDLAEGEDEVLATLEAADEAVQLQARELACRTLERLCAYRVGVCPVTVRVGPHLPSCRYAAVYGGHSGLTPVNWGGTWSNTGCACPRSQCERRLPSPIGRVDEVKVDNTVITDYRVEDDSYLVWTGTGDCPFTGKDIEVTYVNAYEPGVSGERAATILAVEYAQALQGADCRLPTGVTSIARQGVTMTIAEGSFPGGMTGVPEVDAFIALWNPHNIDPPQVWTPDAPVVRRIS